jgi:hypothetical protein
VENKNETQSFPAINRSLLVVAAISFGENSFNHASSVLGLLV